MKKRTKRDLTLFFGAIVIIAVVMFMNSQVGRKGMREDYEALLIVLQDERIDKGVLNLLEWKYMRETKGSLRKGAAFAESTLR